MIDNKLKEIEMKDNLVNADLNIDTLKVLIIKNEYTLDRFKYDIKNNPFMLDELLFGINKDKELANKVKQMMTELINNQNYDYFYKVLHSLDINDELSFGCDILNEIFSIKEFHESFDIFINIMNSSYYFDIDLFTNTSENRRLLVSFKKYDLLLYKYIEQYGLNEFANQINNNNYIICFNLLHFVANDDYYKSDKFTKKLIWLDYNRSLIYNSEFAWFYPLNNKRNLTKFIFDKFKNNEHIIYQEINRGINYENDYSNKNDNNFLTDSEINDITKYMKSLTTKYYKADF